MYTNVKVIDDKELKFSPLTTMAFAKKNHFTFLTSQEFFSASRSQPILFTQNDKNEWGAIALLGLKEGENLFIDTHDHWKVGEYIPAFLRRYPFIFIHNEDKLILAYDSDCEALSCDKGEPLFDQEGNKTAITEAIMNFMQEYQNSAIQTQAWLSELFSYNLLEESHVEVTVDNEDFSFGGFYRINEEKLNQLEQTIIQRLIESGAYKLVIAHLISLGNFDKLSLYKKLK